MAKASPVKDWKKKALDSDSGVVSPISPSATPHVHMLIDRSGSMASLRSDVIAGINAFVADQATSTQDGRCLMSLYQFDTSGHDTLFSGLDVTDVREATDADFLPRGGTPLFDAIGKTITAAQLALESPHTGAELPIVVIFTDGEENSSREYTRDAIFALIKAKEAAGWIFTYLGANQDAYTQSGTFGVQAASAQNFTPDSRGVAQAYFSVTAAVSNTRSRAAAGLSNSAETFYTTSPVGKAADVDHASRGTSSPASVTPTTSAAPADTAPRGWSKSKSEGK